MIQTDFPHMMFCPRWFCLFLKPWDLFTSSPGIPPLKRKCDLDCILLCQRPNKYNHNVTQGKSELRTGRTNDYWFLQKKKGWKENSILIVLVEKQKFLEYSLKSSLQDFGLLCSFKNFCLSLSLPPHCACACAWWPLGNPLSLSRSSPSCVSRQGFSLEHEVCWLS